MNKISIVLATYNGEAYIQQQLESIKNQSEEIHEVLIYDDQSCDQTCCIVQDYIREYQLPWKLYQQEENCGYIKNFASALQKSSGDLIFLCDQDDIWETDKVACIVKQFDQHPQALCINTSFTYINGDNQPIQQDGQLNNYGMLWNCVEQQQGICIGLEEIVYHNISMGCTMALRSSMRDIYIAHSNFCVPHDWELNRIAATYEGLYFFQAPLIRYRIHENNTVGNDNVNGRSHEKRIKNAHTMYTYTDSYRQYVDIFNEEQYALCEYVNTVSAKRYELLQHNKKRNWLYLIRRISTYRKIVSYKGMLADLLNRSM